MTTKDDRATSKFARRHLRLGVWATAASALWLACRSSTPGAGSDLVTFKVEPDPCGLPSGAVPANRIIDLATVGPIEEFRYEAGRVLMRGGNRWILWNADQRAQLAAATRPLITASDGASRFGFADLRGGLLVVQTSAAAFELRSSTDGAVAGVVNAAALDQGIAIDGSYFWTLTAAEGEGLTAWSATGEKLASAAAATGGQAAALPGELRIAYDDHVDRLKLTDGSFSSAPIPAGTFHAWFSDGSHFLNYEGTRIYDGATLAEVAAVTGPGFDGGHGAFVWRLAINEHRLDLFSLSRQPARVATYSAETVAEVGRGRLGILEPAVPGADDAPRAVKVINLDASTNVAVTVPFTGPVWPAVAENNHYVQAIGPQQNVGQLSSGATLGCGNAEYAGADDGTLVIATDLGVLVFKVGEQTTTPLGRFTVVGHRPEISSDGTAVALASQNLQGYGAEMVWVLSPPTGKVLHTWGRRGAHGPVSPTPDPDYVADFSLARNAPRLALSFQTLTAEGGRVAHVRLSDLAGEQTEEVSATSTDIRLTPDGTRLLYATGDRHGGSTVLSGGAFVPAAGHASNWWDDAHYIARQYGRDASGVEILTAPLLYDLQGVASSSVSLPLDVDRAFVLSLGTYQHSAVVPLQGDRIFSGLDASVLDARTGALLWGKPTLRCVAGGHAITDSDGVVSSEPL